MFLKDKIEIATRLLMYDICLSVCISESKALKELLTTVVDSDLLDWQIFKFQWSFFTVVIDSTTSIGIEVSKRLWFTSVVSKFNTCYTIRIQIRRPLVPFNMSNPYVSNVTILQALYRWPGWWFIITFWSLTIGFTNVVLWNEIC